MQSKVVSINELTEDNPTFCLSALRVFDQCHECQVYQMNEVHNTLDKLACKPHIKKEYLEIREEKLKLLKRLKEISSYEKTL